MNLAEHDERVKKGNPRWETAAMVVSFGLLWAYLLARQAALQAAAHSGVANPKVQMSPLWTVAQVAAIVVLLFVLVRRMRRATTAMRAASQIRPGFPPGFTPGKFEPNGHSRNGDSLSGHSAASQNGAARNGKRKS